YFSYLISFTDTPTTEIYTLSLHDALPIYRAFPLHRSAWHNLRAFRRHLLLVPQSDRPKDERLLGQSAFLADADLHERDLSSDVLDRKSTRLNSSHVAISYAVFCLKKKTSV